MKGKNDTNGREKKSKSPQEQPPGGAGVADVGRTKAEQMDHGDHFQLCIKLDPLPKYGLFNGKQQTAFDCFRELSEMEQHAMEKHVFANVKTFFCLCLLNE